PRSSPRSPARRGAPSSPGPRGASPKAEGRTRPKARARTRSIDQLLRHGTNRDPPHYEREEDEEPDAGNVRPLEAEQHRITYEHDRLVQRVERGEHLDRLGEPVEREERPGHEKERRQHRAHDV